MVGREQLFLAHAVVWPLLMYVWWRGAAAAHASCVSWDIQVLVCSALGEANGSCKDRNTSVDVAMKSAKYDCTGDACAVSVVQTIDRTPNSNHMHVGMLLLSDADMCTDDISLTAAIGICCLDAAYLHC